MEKKRGKKPWLDSLILGDAWKSVECCWRNFRAVNVGNECVLEMKVWEENQSRLQKKEKVGLLRGNERAWKCNLDVSPRVCVWVCVWVEKSKEGSSFADVTVSNCFHIDGLGPGARQPLCMDVSGTHQLIWVGRRRHMQGLHTCTQFMHQFTHMRTVYAPVYTCTWFTHIHTGYTHAHSLYTWTQFTYLHTVYTPVYTNAHGLHTCVNHAHSLHACAWFTHTCTVYTLAHC